MYSVDLYSRVRRACHVDGMSKSAAARLFGIHRKTVAKMLKHSVPPGYRREGPPVRPKLDPFIGIIEQILEDDKCLLKKQRHTSKRIFERLRDEHGFTGKITIVTDYVRERKRRTREVFVPLVHAPGHAQVDFGEALGVIGGVERKLHYFAMALPHSDAFFIKAYPGESEPLKAPLVRAQWRTKRSATGMSRPSRSSAACRCRRSTIVRWTSNRSCESIARRTTIAVAKICGDGKRERTITFAELQSHYLFEDRFGRPGKGNE